MNRSLKLSMLIALALGSGQALAVDMGQIQVKSALWQPLLAEIPMTAATPAELKGLTVQLASNEDFARAGIIGGRPSVPLNFSVVNSGGRPVIRITSTVPVNDPYLDLLIEVNGHDGRSVREFAILLDPPHSTPGAGPVAAAQVSQHQAPVRPKPSVSSTTSAPAPVPHPLHAPAAPKVDNARSGPLKDKYGPVQSGQTLSSIARRAAPGAGVNMDQMMIALKQANPDAFYRDNINTLKRGVILRIPSAADAQTLAVAEAIAEVRRQNSDWRAGRVGKATAVADGATRSANSGAASSRANAAEDRLSLVPAADQKGSGGQGGRTGDKGEQASPGLRQELQRTKESLASVQQQNEDLKARLQDLNDINGKNERLLSLKDNQIAELQNKLAAARKAAGQPAQSAPVAAGTATAPAAVAAAKPPVPVAAAGTAAAPASTPAASSSVKTVAPVPPASNTKPVAAPTPARMVDEPWYMQTWAWAAGAGAVVVLVLLAMLGRRRKAAAEAESLQASLADRFGSHTIGHDPSDIDQNELLDQLAEHPDDIGLHLELVTLYYSRRDVEHFEAAAEAMHAHITDNDQNEWQDVVHMGEDLAPGHPLFDHHTELSAHDLHEAPRAFDIDRYTSHDMLSDIETPEARMPPPLPPSKTVDEYHFNFGDNKPDEPVEPAFDKLEQPVEATAPPAMWDLRDEPEHAPPPVTSHADFSPADFPFDETQPHVVSAEHDDSQAHALDDFNDDPADTKLDLARAYIDMGDADGARAMLDEVVKEGTQVQQDVARRLLETLR